jgi:hypothetical protein
MKALETTRLSLFIVSALLAAGCGMAGGEKTRIEEDGEEDAPQDGEPTEQEMPVPGEDIDEIPRLEDGVYVGDECKPEGRSDRRCASHAECNDRVFCNGEERCGLFCGEAFCYTAGFPLPCPANPTDPVCLPAFCIEEQRACVYAPKDADRDGYVDAACPDQAGDDCDDDNPAVHPGLADACDGTDNNCNGVVDEEGWSGEAPARLGGGGAVSASGPVLAASGSGWTAAWIEDGRTVHVAAVDGVTPPSTGPLHTAPEGAVVGNLAVLGGGGAGAVVWSETDGSGSRILLKRVADGSGGEAFILHASPVVLEGIGDVAAAPAAGSAEKAGIFFRMGVGGEGGNYEIFCLPVEDLSASPPRLGTASPVRLTSALGFSGHPDAAAVESGWLVVWDDERNGVKQIYLAAVAFDGTPVAGAPVPVTSSPADAQDPRIACLEDGTGCAVVWTDERYGSFSIFAAAVGTDGRSVGPEVAVSGTDLNAWSPAIAADDARGQFAIVFSAGSAPNENRIHAAMIVRGADEAPEATIVPSESADALDPRASIDASGRLALVWQDLTFGSGASVSIAVLSCSHP